MNIININFHTLNGQWTIQIFQLDFSFSFFYAESFTPNCLWVLECRRNPTESVVSKILPLVQKSHFLCSNKIFRCRIESMRTYHSRLTNLYVFQVVTASLRHSKEIEFSLCPHWMRRGTWGNSSIHCNLGLRVVDYFQISDSLFSGKKLPPPLPKCQWVGGWMLVPQCLSGHVEEKRNFSLP